MQYLAGLKLNSSIFEGEKIGVLETKVAKKICHDTLYLSFSCNLIGYFKQGLKFDWLFYFYCSLLVGWGKMQFKAKNGAIHE